MHFHTPIRQTMVVIYLIGFDSHFPKFLYSHTQKRYGNLSNFKDKEIDIVIDLHTHKTRWNYYQKGLALFK